MYFFCGDELYNINDLRFVAELLNLSANLISVSALGSVFSAEFLHILPILNENSLLFC